MITAINGRPVKDASGLRNSIGLLSIGEKVDIALLRDGKPRRVTAVISERDTVAEAKAAGAHPGLEGADIVDGRGRRADPQRSRTAAPRRSAACAPTT